jgi:hypothetical protein
MPVRISSRQCRKPKDQSFCYRFLQKMPSPLGGGLLELDLVS